MSDYIKLRKGLMECVQRSTGSCECTNEIDCAKCIISKYTNGNRAALLKLKVQAKVNKPDYYKSNLDGQVTLAFSILAFFMAIDSIGNMLQMLYIIIAVVIYLLVYLRDKYKSKSEFKFAIWDEYMMAAIEDLEREYLKDEHLQKE